MEDRFIFSCVSKQPPTRYSLLPSRLKQLLCTSIVGVNAQECSTHGPLGAVVFLELAMALEVTGRPDQSATIYKVLRRSKNREVRAQAKRYGGVMIPYSVPHASFSSFSPFPPSHAMHTAMATMVRC